MKILFFVLFISNFTFSQSIEYKTSPALRDSVMKYLDFKNKKYGCCWKEDNHVVTAVFFDLSDDKNSSLEKLCALTNRFVYMTDKVKIPIIFDSDFYMSTITNKKEGAVITTKSKGPLGGLVCQFESYFESGKVLKVFHDQ